MPETLGVGFGHPFYFGRVIDSSGLRLRKLQIQYIRDAKGMRVIVPWQPTAFKWPILAIMAAVFSAYWAVIEGWELALLCSPLSAYGAAAIAFNRREIRLYGESVDWLSTP